MDPVAHCNKLRTHSSLTVNNNTSTGRFASFGSFVFALTSRMDKQLILSSGGLPLLLFELLAPLSSTGFDMADEVPQLKCL